MTKRCGDTIKNLFFPQTTDGTRRISPTPRHNIIYYYYCPRRVRCLRRRLITLIVSLIRNNVLCLFNGRHRQRVIINIFGQWRSV